MIIYKNTELRCVVMLHRRGTLENIIYLINIITIEEIISNGSIRLIKLAEQDT